MQMAMLQVVDEIHVSTHQLPTVWNRSAPQKVQAMLKLYLDERLDEGDGGR